MLVVGDVHYYIISATDIKAVRPLPTIHSSSASISSHSSRMSRCSKLAAQAIASQSTSARSSPILGSDVSLFSRSSDIESPLSIISPLMALSILKADQEDPLHHRGLADDADGGPGSSAATPTVTMEQEVIQPPNPRRRGSQGMASSTTSTPTFAQGGLTFHHQPGRPSRLRKAIETEDPQDLGPSNDGPVAIIPGAGAGSFAEGDAQDGSFSPMTPPINNHHSSGSSQASPSSAAGQSPLFQSLMDSRVRGRSNTVSSVSSDRSSVSTMSAGSHASKCSTATDDSNSTTNSSNSECYSPSEPNTTTTNSAEKQTSSKSNDDGSEDNVVYKFRYLASDDDFLLRSAVRQIFKTNALESWDAILFTISHNALREYSNQGGEQVLQPLGGAHGDLQQRQQSLPSSPVPVSAQAQSQQHQQNQQELAVTSSPTPPTAAAVVTAQYSQNQAQSANLPPLIVPRSDDIVPSSSETELHHQQDNSSASSNNTSYFDSEDSTGTPSSPLHRRIGRTGEGLYSAGVNRRPCGFDIQSFSHTPRHQSQGGHEDLRQGGRGEGLSGGGLSRSMSHNYHSRRMDLFRSLPALPLGASVSGSAGGGPSGDGESSLEGGCGGDAAGSMCGSSKTTTGGHKKLRRVLSKIFLRK